MSNDFVCLQPSCFGIVRDGGLYDEVVCPNCNCVWFNDGDQWWEVPSDSWWALRVRLRYALTDLLQALADTLPSWIKRWWSHD
jgi:hypothetical protein